MLTRPIRSAAISPGRSPAVGSKANQQTVLGIGASGLATGTRRARYLSRQYLDLLRSQEHYFFPATSGYSNPVSRVVPSGAALHRVVQDQPQHLTSIGDSSDGFGVVLAGGPVVGGVVLLGLVGVRGAVEGAVGRAVVLSVLPVLADLGPLLWLETITPLTVIAASNATSRGRSHRLRRCTAASPDHPPASCSGTVTTSIRDPSLGEMSKTVNVAAPGAVAEKAIEVSNVPRVPVPEVAWML